MTKALVGASLAVATLSVMPTVAHADAFGCVGRSVNGAQLVRGDLGKGATTSPGPQLLAFSIGPRTTVRGFMRLMVDYRVVGQSPIKTCKNSAFDKTKYCSVTLLRKQTLRDGAKVCGQFVFVNGDGARALPASSFERDLLLAVHRRILGR